MTPADKVDYAIVGGGLQGCLLAHAILSHQPGSSVLLVERSDDLCGNHTWSLHQTDVPEHARFWFDPLVTRRWSGYRVTFPGLSRRVAIPYATISSAALRADLGTNDAVVGAPWVTAVGRAHGNALRHPLDELPALWRSARDRVRGGHRLPWQGGVSGAVRWRRLSVVHRA